MSDYPIFCRTMTITVPAVAAVPMFGLIVGGIVGAFVAVLVIRGWMQ